MSLHVHIGTLTIEGGSRADGVRLGEALRNRLTELAAEGLSIQPSSVDRIDAGLVPHAASADHTGRHLADRIVRGVKGLGDA